jgi:hypothetical protein
VRELLLAYLLDLHLELGRLARDLLGRVVVGERHGRIAILAALRTLERLLELRQHPPLAQLQQVVLRGAALERLAVDLPLVVDQDDVALLRLTIDRVELREALLEAAELALDGLVGDLRLVATDLEALVLAELRAGPDRDLDRESKRLALLGQIGEVELRIPTGFTPTRAARARTSRRARTRALGEDGLAPEALDHHLRGTLPLRNPGSFMSLPRRSAVRLMLPSTSFGSTSTSTRTRDSGSSFTVVSMEETLDTTWRERLGAWIYTGAPGRLLSFSIDLALSIAALVLWSARRVWERIRRKRTAAPSSM